MEQWKIIVIKVFTEKWLQAIYTGSLATIVALLICK